MRGGIPPTQAAASLWPFYIDRVRAWLTMANEPLTARSAHLGQAHHGLARQITDATKEMTP
ncbi:hypothetical protein ACIQB5_47705 [Streptomyces sp. NPDC088560]|uniref:hypothetical protein n=1 Tax=Streptomyces sp. NPDC088560 TaxID=3365868 RepID=UPI0038094EF1